MKAEVFLDAAYAIALSVPKDSYHSQAVALSNELEAFYTQAFRLYSERPDKEWGLTDCISFVVMQSREMTEALTADDHFQQAGFRALLLEDTRA